MTNSQMNKKEYIEKFNRLILEYTSPSFNVEEDGEDDMAQGGAPDAGMAPGGDMGGAPDAGMDGGMGGDPSAMGGDMGGDPNAMGGDPNAAGGDMGGGEATPPEGFQPQGVDPNAGLDGMGGDPNAQPGMDAGMGGDPNAMGGDDEVIDVDDLTDSQEETEKKVDALSGKFERLMSSLDGLEKRNPTPLQRMTMRSTKSAPYSMTPNEYMNNYAPDNYSDADDNNGADDPQYKITKGDIDDFTDYSSIAKDLGGKFDLHNILGY